MSLSLRSLIDVMPIGWSGSCSLIRSELMSIPHACAKGISFSASVTGMRHTLLILSHRAVLKLSFSDWISSLSYGVSSIMCCLSKYTLCSVDCCHVAFYEGVHILIFCVSSC